MITAIHTTIHKEVIEKELEKILKKYGVKGTLLQRDHRNLVLKINEGAVNFAKWTKSSLVSEEIRRSCHYVNIHYIENNFCEEALQFLLDVLDALKNKGNHDNSPPEIDHSDVKWYVAIKIGECDKPYKVTYPR